MEQAFTSLISSAFLLDKGLHHYLSHTFGTKASDEPDFKLIKPSTGQEYKSRPRTKQRLKDTREKEEQLTKLHLQPANRKLH